MNLKAKNTFNGVGPIPWAFKATGVILKYEEAWGNLEQEITAWKKALADAAGLCQRSAINDDAVVPG